MKQLLTLLILFTAFFGYSQNDNPYAKFGYKGNTIKTPQERMNYMLIISNQDTLSIVNKIGFDPKVGKYYFFDKENNVFFQDTLVIEQTSRFFAIDPLAKDYPHNAPYAFSENRVLDAIELEGREAFLIHGTTQTNSGTVFSDKAEKQFQRIGGNSYIDDKFSWTAPLTNNATFHRAMAAKELINHVVSTRNKLISNGTITDDEPITLIGYSHGGNVTTQALDEISKRTGRKINLITVSTPAYETPESLNSAGLNGLEDPNKKSSINKHIHIVHENDRVGSFWAQGEKTYNPLNSEGHGVDNFVIKESEINLKGSIESHTKFPAHNNLPNVLQKIPTIPQK